MDCFDNQICCCGVCFDRIAKIDREAAYFWCDAVNFGFEYLVIDDDRIFKILEKNGYVITTEYSVNKLSVKILGINYTKKVACIKNCFVDK
jgi:hypothetical protein